MGKMIGILLFVVGVWVSMEVYTEGPSNAFGGRLAFLLDDGGRSSDDGEGPARRVGTSVERHHNEADARRERMLAE